MGRARRYHGPVRGHELPWFALTAILAGAIACSADTTLMVELRRVAPAADPDCGAPADAQTLVVTALGDFAATEVTAVSRSLDEAGPLSIDIFPADTRVLRVDVLGAGGAVRATGKTAPLDLGALDDGDVLSVFMAPPRGVCPTGPPMHARVGPLLARAGAGVLIAGGAGADGAAVYPIERYDPATGALDVVIDEHYGRGEHGLVGASMTALGPAHDTVVIAGGAVPAYQVYDARTGELSAALFLDPGRAHHAALALDASRVLLAGGCSPVGEDGRCAPASALLSTSILDVDTRQVSPGPPLLRARAGGVAVRESQGAVLLVGGVDDTGAAVTEIERVRLDGGAGELVAGSAGSAAVLAGGGALMAFAADDAAAAVLPPGASALSPVASAPWPLVGATLTPLEDGRVLVAGAQTGGPAAEQGRLLFYEPGRAAFQVLSTSGVLPGRDHGAVRLDDGTVFLVGGVDADAPASAPQPRAWIARPDHTGPYTSDLTITFSDAERVQHLIPRDPRRWAQASLPDQVARYVLTSSGGGLPSEWVVMAGPVFTRGELAVRARVEQGGVALLLGFRDPERYHAAVLIPGQPATLYHVEDGVPRVVAPCRDQVIRADDVAPGAGVEAADLALVLGARAVTVHAGGREVLRCDDPGPVAPGLFGVGVVGAAGAAVHMEFLAASR